MKESIKKITLLHSKVLQEYFREHTGLGGPVDDRYKVHGTVRGKHYD